MCDFALVMTLVSTMVSPLSTDFTMRIGDTLELTHTSPLPSSLVQCSQEKVPAGTVIDSVPTECHFSKFLSMVSRRDFVASISISIGCVEPGITKIILWNAKSAGVTSTLPYLTPSDSRLECPISIQ